MKPKVVDRNGPGTVEVQPGLWEKKKKALLCNPPKYCSNTERWKLCITQQSNPHHIYCTLAGPPSISHHSGAENPSPDKWPQYSFSGGLLKSSTTQRRLVGYFGPSCEQYVGDSIQSWTWVICGGQLPPQSWVYKYSFGLFLRNTSPLCKGFWKTSCLLRWIPNIYKKRGHILVSASRPVDI